METKKVLAIDIGASSGRAILGIYDGNKIELQEIHRFSNDPVTINGVVYWDVLRLLFEIKESLVKAKPYGKINSIGIDTWGVDFGLLDHEGHLLNNPIHYRDERTVGMVEKSFEYLPKDEFYQITGNQFMELNTAFQLFSMVQKDSHLLKLADVMLLMPDLFNYFLTGKKVSERTIASTTQIYDAHMQKWSEKIIRELNIPAHLFPEIIESGTVIGQISPEIREELGIDAIDVIAVAGHDTQCAQVAVPISHDEKFINHEQSAMENDFVFLSCGTWSLLGTELDAPLINDQTLAFNITNEAAHAGKISFLKNITGLWLVQESKRQWEREGKNHSYSELEQMAASSPPFKYLINPDDERFAAAGNIPKRISAYCHETNQHTPENMGEVIRGINESLALTYRKALEELEACTGIRYPVIHMLGGGIQSELLCQMTANACGRPVIAGPVEATVLGNIAIQLMATKCVTSLEQARHLIKTSQEIKTYQPKEVEAWQQQYDQFKTLIK